MWFVESCNTSEEDLEVIVVEHDFTSHKEGLRRYDTTVLPGYPYLGYPKPRLSERSSERGVCLKKGYFSLKSQSLRLSRVHVFVCVIRTCSM